MVIRETKKSIVRFIPECTCNKRIKRVYWKTSRFNDDLNEKNEWATDHEELHKLSRAIVDFIAETGKLETQAIVDHFSEHKERQLQIAANLGMYPIIFPKKRRAPPAEFVRLKQHAYNLTEDYRRAKYAPTEIKDEEPPLIEE